jgi:protein dispatched 1
MTIIIAPWLFDTLQLCYYSDMLFYYDVARQAFYDMFLAIGSLIFIFCFIWFQTKSLWITGFAVLSIVTSFFISNLVYRVILDYIYFGYFHVVAIFIILGIGNSVFYLINLLI